MITFHPEFSIIPPDQRPLWPIPVCVSMRNLSPRQVVNLIDSGNLSWAWDLAAPGAKRREIRIWHHSITTWSPATGRDATADIPESEVLADIIPSWHPHSSDLARRLQVSRDLVADLIRAGLLLVQSAAVKKQGPNAACRIDRASVIAFLKARRCGAIGPITPILPILPLDSVPASER